MTKLRFATLVGLEALLFLFLSVVYGSQQVATCLALADKCAQIARVVIYEGPGAFIHNPLAYLAMFLIAAAASYVYFRWRRGRLDDQQPTATDSA